MFQREAEYIGNAELNNDDGQAATPARDLLCTINFSTRRDAKYDGPDERRTEYIEKLRRHVELGLQLIERQKEMVERHRSEGRDTKPAEDLLAALERTQKVFERDLARFELRKW